MRAYIILASTFFLSLIFNPSYGQQSADIGVLLSNVEHGQIAIDFRKPINEKLRWNVAVSMGGDNGQFGRQLKSTSMDTTVFTTSFNSADQQTLRFGLAHKMSDWPVYLRLDGMIGHRTRYLHRGEEIRLLLDDGTWSSPFNSSGVDIVETFSDVAFTSRRFVVPGVQLGLEADLPIKGRFSLGVQLVSRLQSPIYVEDFNTRDPENVFSTAPTSTLDFDMYAALGLRYSLKKSAS